MEMSYIAIHRWNETVGMKVLGMSDALMSDVAYFVSPPSSSRVPRIGKGQSLPLLSSGFRIGRPWPLSLSRLFLSSFQKNSLIPKSNYLFFVIFVQIVLKKNYYRNIIITRENSSLESLKQNFK